MLRIHFGGKFNDPINVCGIFVNLNKTHFFTNNLILSEKQFKVNSK